MTNAASNGVYANGAQANGLTARYEESAYLDYLPSIYRQDMFLGRFLHVFEDILTPIQRLADTLPERFDPNITTPPMLEFLARWVAAPGAGLPEDRWRKAILHSVWLYRWRGTRIGLTRALELIAGQRPFISDNSTGMVLGSDASMGVNTALSDPAPLQFHVSFECKEDEIDTSLVDDIIQAYKPGHVTYTVSFSP
jgi:phage tail-like protein